MFKKIIAGVALGAALVMGGQVAYINQAEAVDVYAGEQTKFDIKQVYYIDTDTLSQNNNGTIIRVKAKCVQDGQNMGYSSYEFVNNNGEWYGCEDGNKASKNTVKGITVYQIILNACLNNL